VEEGERRKENSLGGSSLSTKLQSVSIAGVVYAEPHKSQRDEGTKLEARV
jgi:hypothetical protein